ncbi:MAG: hypothetical protein ACQETM_08000 [Bacteroidota bacterium]
MNNTASTSHKAPGEYFDETSFKTLYGGVFVTWVTTSIFVDIFGLTDPKIPGLIIALLVAFIGFFLSENRTIRKLLVTPFNGFLIYLTIMGGTSFFPVPEQYDAGALPAVAGEETGINGEVAEQPGFVLFQPWNPDRQLVETTQQLKAEKESARQRTEQLQAENQQLAASKQDLENKVQRYEIRLDSTRNILQQIQLSPQQQQTIMPMLQLE